MANIFIGMLLFIASISMFSFSTLYGAVDRTFTGLDDVIIREGVNVVSLYRPYFDTKLTSKYIREYFDVNLDRYRPHVSYLYQIEYGDEFKDEGIYYPTSVNVWFQAKFGGYVYTDELTYRITEGELYYV